MARARNIKPRFFMNEDLAECEPLARLLFAGLWCIADREGRLEDRPKRIKIETLPYDDCDVDELLNELQEHGFILRYEASGNNYIQIVNFKKHQNPHIKESKSTIPPPKKEQAPCNNKVAPYEHSTSIVQTPEKHETSPADSLNLIPDSLNNSSSELCPDKPLENLKENSEIDEKLEELGEPDNPKPPKDKDKIPIFEVGSQQYKLALLMRSCILRNLPKAKVPVASPEKLKRWAYDIDLMMRIDCRSPDEIKQLIDWSQKDQFWKANILSPGKLRTKWDTLVAHRMREMERNRGAPKQAPPQATNFQQRKYSQEMYDKIKKIGMG